jgi:hypothetical protein
VEDTHTSPNGSQAPQRPAEVRVSFGPGDTDDMPIDWAERFLTHLFTTNKPVFGATMLAIWDITVPTERRRGRPALGDDQ